MARSSKIILSNGKSRPITESRVERGGINKNPSAMLTRPAPPQPYKPAPSSGPGSKVKG